MIAIKIDFPAGRWHATAWGTHVNEGVPEWPPCPWRLCRALLAAWHWKDRRDEPALRALLVKLATTPPAYLLPEASAAHTRHYMPGGDGKKTKIFDTFVHVSEGQSLWIRWDAMLDDGERALLARLLASFSYLGRAESLVSAALVADHEAPVLDSRVPWTRAAKDSTLHDGEPIRLLAPQEAYAYATWAAGLNPPSTTGKKTKAKKKGTTLPETLHDALQLDTADWKKDGWNLPPGSRWLDYVRPRDCFKIAPTTRPRSIHKAALPTVARFAITSKVPPAITQALSLGERFHQGLCSRLKPGESSPNLTGCDHDKKPLTGNAHAYFLPECDTHGYVTHMTVHAPGGFDAIACRAFSRLDKVWGSEGFDLQVVLLATGHTDDFNPTSPYFRPARIWRSLTPFVPVRHAKATRSGVAKLDPENGLQIGSPEHDCLRLLGLVAPNLPRTQIRLLGPRIRTGLRDISCLDFQRQRRHGGGTRSDHRGYALELEFEKPAALPLALGYAAHFGLGLFVPAG